MDDYVDYLKKFLRRSAAKGGWVGIIGRDPKFTGAPLTSLELGTAVPVIHDIQLYY